MSIIDEIKDSFKKGSTLTRLIYFNLAVFVLVNLVEIIFYLANSHGGYSQFLIQLAVPADLSILARKPWTLITYMFTHKGFIHLLFNLLWLFWFGKVFLEYFDGKKLVGVYLLGGLSGAIFYIAAFNLLPVFTNDIGLSIALGASASVTAVSIAIAVYVPNYNWNLMFIGRVKIIYVAIAVFFLSTLIEISDNAGGKIAHIGGAVFGYFYAYRYKQGKDITRGFNRFLENLFAFFRPKPKIRVAYKKSETDLDYNKRKGDEQKNVDRILDKIAKSGYSSLSASEKEVLFRQSKK
ncbi:MAG TPA: rhomboid family intramembrane serine protease [Bacteroides sp.]|nr:rhomboid family intramembrane serine protease [Bacteroides sp.]